MKKTTLLAMILNVSDEDAEHISALFQAGYVIRVDSRFDFVSLCKRLENEKKLCSVEI